MGAGYKGESEKGLQYTEGNTGVNGESPVRHVDVSRYIEGAVVGVDTLVKEYGKDSYHTGKGKRIEELPLRLKITKDFREVIRLFKENGGYKKEHGTGYTDSRYYPIYTVKDCTEDSIRDKEKVENYFEGLGIEVKEVVGIDATVTLEVRSLLIGEFLKNYIAVK